MEFLLKPDFDLVLLKIHMLWHIRYVSGISLCADAVASLNAITDPIFNQDDSNSWLQSCHFTAGLVPGTLILDQIKTQVYFFKPDEELDF